MGCGASCAASYGAVEETAARIVEDVRGRAEEAIDKVKDMGRDMKLRGVTLDEEVASLKISLKKECSALDEVADAYRDWAAASSNVLLLPGLYVWSAKEDFIGGQSAALALRRHSAYQADITRLTLDCRRSVNSECVTKLREAEEMLKACLETVYIYEDEALSAHQTSEKVTKLQHALQTLRDDASNTPPEKQEEYAKKMIEAEERVNAAVQEKAQAEDKVATAKAKTLEQSSSKRQLAELQMGAAFVALHGAFEWCLSSVTVCSNRRASKLSSRSTTRRQRL
jgi:hypothetical protein